MSMAENYFKCALEIIELHKKKMLSDKSMI
jgi:hypothetical protein